MGNLFGAIEELVKATLPLYSVHWALLQSNFELLTIGTQLSNLQVLSMTGHSADPIKKSYRLSTQLWPSIRKQD